MLQAARSQFHSSNAQSTSKSIANGTTQYWQKKGVHIGMHGLHPNGNNENAG